MKVRSFKEEDYNDVSSWWAEQGWPVLPLEILSPTGYVAEEDGNLIAATWVFPTNCPIYIMEWTVGNPKVEWDKRNEGLKLVTDEACRWAKEDGAVQVFTMTKHERFINKLEEFGFDKTDSGMTHLMRRL